MDLALTHERRIDIVQQDGHGEPPPDTQPLVQDNHAPQAGGGLQAMGPDPAPGVRLSIPQIATSAIDLVSWATAGYALRGTSGASVGALIGAALAEAHVARPHNAAGLCLRASVAAIGGLLGAMTIGAGAPANDEFTGRLAMYGAMLMAMEALLVCRGVG